MKHTTEELRQLQNKSLEEKIQISAARIIEWYERWDGKVAVSFSGGKDSTVLVDIVRRIYPNVTVCFSDTGLEFPELRKFAMNYGNVTVVKPKLSFGEVITKYGYPIISKQSSRMVWDIQHSTERNKATVNLRLTGYNRDGKYCPTMKLAKSG